jgi:hypothetical protein
LRGSRKWNDRWQSFLKGSLQRNSLGESHSTGSGDAEIGMSYEAFPLYTYHPWRPRVFLLASLIAPFGQSPYESDQPRLESKGLGHWTPKIGVMASRQWSAWDAFTFFEVQRPIPKTFERVGKVRPGWKWVGKLGGGYSIASWRMGVSYGPSFESKRSFQTGEVTSHQGPKQVWDSELSVSYRANDKWSASVSYSDQSLGGPAKNVAVERGLQMGFMIHGL